MGLRLRYRQWHPLPWVTLGFGFDPVDWGYFNLDVSGCVNPKCDPYFNVALDLFGLATAFFLHERIEDAEPEA